MEFKTENKVTDDVAEVLPSVNSQEHVIYDSNVESSDEEYYSNDSWYYNKARKVIKTDTRAGLDKKGLLNHLFTKKIEDYDLVALFDYQARSNDDVDLRKGHFLKLLDDNVDGDWINVKTKTGTGLVPATYVAKIESLESQE